MVPGCDNEIRVKMVKAPCDPSYVTIIIVFDMKVIHFITLLFNFSISIRFGSKRKCFNDNKSQNNPDHGYILEPNIQH